jgi:hypothetical protein
MKKVNWQYLVDALLFVSAVGVAFIGLLMAFVIPGGPSFVDSDKYLLGLHRHDWGDIHLYLGITFSVLAVIHLLLGWSWIKGKTRSLFGDKWIAALVVMGMLPIILLAASWSAFTKRTGAYGQDDLRADKIHLRALEAGQVPTYSINTIRSTHPITDKRSGLEPQSSTTTESKPAAQEVKDHRSNHHAGEEAGSARDRDAEREFEIVITGQTTLRDIERETGISARLLADHLRLPQNASPDQRLGRLRKEHGFTMQEVRDYVSSQLGP